MPFQKMAREEVFGRYRLIARLGQGGMAEVFLARLVGAGGVEKLVAIKRMLPSLSDDRTFVAMFHKEGRITAQLDHPNVCHAYEFDEAGGTLFLAMEFLRGLPWLEIVPAIPDRPSSPLARFVTGVVVQACEGLHHAHTSIGIDGQPRPIVHRDVSPSNLFVTAEGIVKLLDFGVSKVLTEATSTASGVIKGKVSYMAPEQIRGMSLDARADIFSLAVVTWEALAGRALFRRASDYDTIMAVAETRIPALPGGDPAIERIDAVLHRALARNRTDRHGSAREFADDLQQALIPHGAPMLASEIQAHFSMWLGPSLARRSRDLAALIGGGRQAEGLTDDRTAIHEPAPSSGARLRDVSVRVGGSALEATETLRDIPMNSSADTITDVSPAPFAEPSDAVMTAPSTKVARPRAPIPQEPAQVGMYSSTDMLTTDTLTEWLSARSDDAPGVATIALSGELTRPRIPAERDALPLGRPEWVPTVPLPPPPPRSRRPRLALIAFATIAIVIGVIVALLLG